MPPLSIVRANFEDLDFFLSLAKEEGWNPGLCDAKPFFYTDPDGFFLGEIAGEKIGCISAVAYNGEFGFLGFYIVHPSYRGQGFGLQLWEHAIDYLGARCIGLDGVIAQQDNYKKSHFQLHYRNIRFEGKDSGHSSKNLIHLQGIPLPTLLEYDMSVFGLSRELFLEHWLAMPNAYSLGKMSGEVLQGYGVIRRCSNGFKIGPLFAEDRAIAEEIYSALCAIAEGQAVFLDVPETNLQAMGLAAGRKMRKVFETARMYNRPPPKQRLNNIYGVTSFELG